jgi:hypothetical protein
MQCVRWFDSFRARGRPAGLRRRATGKPIIAQAGYGNAMITGAIVIGMVGVAAGFTWDYLIKRDG